MTILISLFLLSLTTIAQCQKQTINPTNTGAGTCSCDLNRGLCDVSCCCDTDCSTKDLNTFNCYPKANKDSYSFPSTSNVQSRCFKDIPIYRSNSPYVIRKEGDLVCVDYERDADADNTDYQQLINGKIYSGVSARSINTDNSASSPLGTPTNLTNYQVGTSIFKYISSTSSASYFYLPISLFNSQLCSGLQPITYLNNFQSTCVNTITASTCVDGFDTTKYTSGICLIPNPSALAGLNPSTVCCTVTGSPSSWAPSTCTDALQTLVMTISYSNPTGIMSCAIILTTTTAPLNTIVLQTFTVNFLQSESTATSTSNSGNPGYLQGARVIAGTPVGSVISTSAFTILQASSDGSCSQTNRVPILFGQNVRSECFFSITSPESCPSIAIASASNIYVPFTSFNLYVAAYGNSDVSNINSNWRSVTFCTSEIGSSNEPVCQTGSMPTPSASLCYVRLDIQIVYANIGSVTNPQPIIGAVTLYFQGMTTPSTTPILITQSVTFQDVSNAPATEGNQIPRPNTRLPGDFFYPFSLSRATNSITFSSFLYLLTAFLLILM